jgi:hypothetical protein
MRRAPTRTHRLNVDYCEVAPVDSLAVLVVRTECPASVKK